METDTGFIGLLHYYPYFRISQITGRILGPGITGQLQCPDPGISTTDIKVATAAATAFNLAWRGFQALHDRIRGVLPDRRERPLADVAETVMPPEGIRVDLTEVIDIGNIDAGTVAAPLPQFCRNVLDFIRVMLHDPLQQVDAVGIIVTGNELQIVATLYVPERGLEQQVHGRSGDSRAAHHCHGYGYRARRS